MQILVLSDVHSEFHRDGGRSFVDSIEAKPDGVVVAGDACSYSQMEAFLRLLCAKFAWVIYIWGNHECYGSSISKVRARALELAKVIPNLFVLDDSECVIDGQRLLGGPLWFRNDPGNVMYAPQLNDFRQIEKFLDEVYRDNERTIDYLEREVSGDDIVVTHHLPSIRSTPQRFQRSKINRFFVCDMEPLISRVQPKLWIHGHTHDSCDYTLGDTRVVCNPFGYAGYELNPGFEEKLVEI